MTPAWFRRELVEDDRGDDVLIVQRKLGAPMTGVMDLATMGRVRGLQRRHGLEETGFVDELTAQLLGEKASAGIPPAWFVRDLREGDMGSDVAALRRNLELPPGPLFTRSVSDAVRRFQASVGFLPTGWVNCDTATALADRAV